jgi:hypothetical protein
VGLFDWSGRALKQAGQGIVWRGALGGAFTPVSPVGPWYVDATLGSDANVGNSSLTPFLTVAQMVAQAGSADVLNFKKGEVWREYVLDPDTAQTWQGYGSSTTLPRISGMDVVTGTWTSTTPTNTWSIPYAVTQSTMTGMDVDGTHYVPAASKAALVAGQFYYDVALATLYLCIVGGDSTMSGKVVEANGNRRSVMATTLGQGGYHFNGIHFHGGTDGTVIMQNCLAASSWTTCRFGHGGAISSVGLLFISEGNNAGHAITDCLFENGNTDCLFINDNPTSVTGYCTFISLYGPLADHIQYGGGSGQSGGATVHHCYHFVQSDSNSHKGCIILGTNQALPGFSAHDNFMDGGNYAVSYGGTAETGHDSYTIDRNVAISTLATSSVGSFGIGSPSVGTRWSFNVSLNAVGAAMNFFDGVARTGLGIYQNTFYGYGLQGITCSAAGDTLGGTIEDNIIYSSTSTNNHIRYRTAGGLTSDYNDIGPNKASGFSYNGTAYNTLALYVTGASQDAHSIHDDPLLNTASNRSGTYGQNSAPVTATYADVAPTSSSPVRAVGLRVAGINDTLANPPDLGAIQYGGAGPGGPVVTAAIRKARKFVAAMRARGLI